MKDVDNVFKLIGIAILADVVLFVVLYFCYRRRLFTAGLAVIAAMLIFENEFYIEKILCLIFPDVRYWHGVSIAILLLFGLLFLLKMGEENGKKFVKIVSLVFSLLIAFNFVMAIPAFITIIRTNQTETNLSGEATVSDSQQGRNVYWLLFDDYAPNVSMMEYYGYDNSPFTDWLEAQGFSVSYTSRNETNRTMVITCNIAHLGYVASYSNDRTLNEDFALVLEKRKNSKVIQTVQANNYEIIGIGYADLYGYTGESVGQVQAGATVDGRDFASLVLGKTALYPFFSTEVNSTAEELLSQLEYLQDPANIPQENTFVIAHFNCPHTPHLFFGDGTIATAQQPSNYFEQYKFATTQMQAIVETIIENDPTAMIALMSDHGNKDKGAYEQKNRCFAALYNGGGDQLDIEGYSGINVMVTILNEVFGTDYAYVPYKMQEEVTSH